MKNTKAYKKFLIKKGTKNDEIQIIQLLNDFPPAGILSECSQKFRQIFLKYLLKSPLGIIIVAFEQDSQRGAGYVIAIRHAVRFWSNFIFRHLLSIDFPLFLKKWKSFIDDFFGIFLKCSEGGKAAAFKKEVGSSLPKFSWSPSNAKVARINFIGVLPEFRGQGLGSALYLFLAEILKREDCKKIEAHIDEGNEASVRLHQKAGWQVQKLREGDYKAILELK